MPNNLPYQLYSDIGDGASCSLPSPSSGGMCQLGMDSPLPIPTGQVQTLPGSQDISGTFGFWDIPMCTKYIVPE